MTQDLQPIIRILLRYGAMWAMTAGYMSAEAGSAFTDPAMLTAVAGLVVALGTEAWYRLAKKEGKPT